MNRKRLAIIAGIVILVSALMLMFWPDSQVDTHADEEVAAGAELALELRGLAAWAGKECEIPNFGGSYLDRFQLVSANFWTSDHLWERSRRVDAFAGTRARGTLMLKRT